MNINGDTIFVNREGEIQIVFPTPPTSFNAVPNYSQFRVWEVKNGIYLIADTENYDPVTLMVSEGGRSHRFLLIFKQNISNREARLYYYYSTVKKLEQHIKTSASSKPTRIRKNNCENRTG